MYILAISKIVEDEFVIVVKEADCFTLVYLYIPKRSACQNWASARDYIDINRLCMALKLNFMF